MESSNARHRFGDPSRWFDIIPLTRDQVRAAVRSANGAFYVYVLSWPDKTPFYVGKGCGERVFQHEAEAWNTSRRTHKLNVIRKIRKEGAQIVYSIDGVFQAEADAHSRERALIAYYGRHDQGQGPLTNQLDGGEGASNPSLEAKMRHAASLGGDAEDPERRIANQFLASIAGGQDSIPIKPWRTIRARAHLLRPSPNKPVPSATIRMSKAIVASAICNEVTLEVGAIIPRRLVVDGVECVIENGCGGDMIHANMVVAVEPRTTPIEEQIKLTSSGLKAVIGHIGRPALEDYGVLLPEG